MQSKIKKRLESIEEKQKRFLDQECLRKTVKEMELWGKERSREYNSPDAIKSREKAYQEVLSIGALRKQAFLNGESMDKYPLPW